MDSNIFEIVKLVLQIGLIILTAFVVPSIKKLINEKTTKEQRENAQFWTAIAIKCAEDIFKEKGQGKLKKDYVIEWLNRNKIKITEEQMNILIDTIVAEFNKNGWNVPIVLNSTQQEEISK